MQQLLRELATTARHQAPWWLLGATGVAVVPVMAAGEPAIGFWRWTMIAAALVAGLVTWLVNKSPAAYGVIILAAVVHLTTSDSLASFEMATSVSSAAALVDLFIALGLVGLLTSLTLRRRGRPSGRDLVEVLVVFTAASTSTWVLLIQPMLDSGAAPLNAMLVSMLVPVHVLIATFMIDLWNDGLRTNRAMQLASLASVFVTAGALGTRLELVAATPSATKDAIRA